MTFRTPAPAAARPHNRGMGRRVGRGTIDGVPAQRPRVVIVDDHPAFRRAARALLDARGFTVVGEASESTAAQTLVARLAPDAVLLDVGLGAECGFDVA